MTNNLNRAVLCGRLLEVIEKDIFPKTQAGVKAGNKVFGAAILQKSDLSLVVAGTNGETINPLFHGEISTLISFYELSESKRPVTESCIFLSTHEPCSLCLSAITWAGFDNFYYLFGYEDTRDAFDIPHDLNILKEVFKIPDGAYARSNSYWHSHDIVAMATEIKGAEAEKLNQQVYLIKKAYGNLSKAYQAEKINNAIPLN
ncbi:MAG: nucleoside deaminase [Pseudomonadota bacterium]|nr:nucleoside deaminase [Pseudomonadota bacterium]